MILSKYFIKICRLFIKMYIWDMHQISWSQHMHLKVNLEFNLKPNVKKYFESSIQKSMQFQGQANVMP